MLAKLVICRTAEQAREYLFKTSVQFDSYDVDFRNLSFKFNGGVVKCVVYRKDDTIHCIRSLQVNSLEFLIGVPYDEEFVQMCFSRLRSIYTYYKEAKDA